MGINRRAVEEKIFIVISNMAAIITSLLLIVIIGMIAIKALPSLSLHYIFTSEFDANGLGKGIANAVIGTLLISLTSVLIATPFALGTAIYLKRYAKNNLFIKSASLLIDILSGTPSIVLGVFGLLVFCISMKSITGGYSLLAGAFAMSLLIMPIIERTAEDAINTVPRMLEDGSYALGATKWDTIKRIIIPYALPGIMTGIILSVGRASEESAIVILTAGYTQLSPTFDFFQDNRMLLGIKIDPLNQIIATLPITVYNSYEFQNLIPISYGFAAALVLIVIVMLINLSARIILWRFKLKTSSASDTGGSYKLGGLFKKKGPGNSNSLIPRVGIFNRSKLESSEKQMDSIFPDLLKKPEKRDVENSIRPYLADPLNETSSSHEHSQTASDIISTTGLLHNEASQSLYDVGPSDGQKITYATGSQIETPSIENETPIIAISAPALEPATVSIQLGEPEEPIQSMIDILPEPAPVHWAGSRAGSSSLQLIIKEDKPMKQSSPNEKTVNGLMSKTKDGKPFLDLLHPPSTSKGKKDTSSSSSIISQVSDMAMPYMISSGPDKVPAGLLAPGHVDLSSSEDAGMSDSQSIDEIPTYNMISEPANLAEETETSVAQRPMPDKINDITHNVKAPAESKASGASDFDLFNVFGGFKKNGKGNNGNDTRSEAATQASPTEEEVKSTMQKPAKKKSLLGSLNLSFSKPKETVEMLDFNVGRLSIPTLDGALKETDVTYEIDPPFQYVHIFFDGEEMSYNVLEPKLSDGEKKYLVIIERALEKLISAKIVAIRPEEREDFLRMRFTDIVKMYGFNLSEAHQDRMFYYIRKNYLGLSKIDIIMKDHYIEDISCNGPNNYLYVYHRIYGSVKTNVSFEELELNKFVMRLAQISGKHISILQPIKDVSMPDGSRANLTMGSEVTKKGATFTIRKFRDKPMSPVELMEYNSIDPLTLAYLWILLDYKKSILVSGGTASGKTTLLNVICSFIRPENKIVSLEDTAELNLVHPNWIQSVTRSGFGAEAGSNSVSGVSGVSAKSPGDIGLYDLLVAALRQRPEYIICGEVRGAEAFTMFQAIAVGHACMGTIHAGTMRELLSRIESNPMNVPRTLFSALDAVCFNAMVRHGDRNVRRVMSVVEILELDADGDLVTNPVFRWDAKNDRFLFTGKSHIFEKIENQLGVSEHELVEEMQARGKFLQSLREHNIRDYAAVVEKIHDYTLNHS
jgi:archaeal flagellar protein FlaI